MGCSTPGFPVLYHLLELAQTHIHWVGDAIQSSRPVVSSSSCLQSFPASGPFPKSDLCIRWPKYWSFSISPSNEYSGLISFRIDWFELLAIQGTLTSIHDYWKNQLYFHFFKKGRGNHRIKNALQYSVHERSNIYLIHKHCVSNEQGIGFLFWFLPFLVSQIWESQIDAENHP